MYCPVWIKIITLLIKKFSVEISVEIDVFNCYCSTIVLQRAVIGWKKAVSTDFAISTGFVMWTTFPDVKVTT